jgi:hypothetical protein
MSVSTLGRLDARRNRRYVRQRVESVDNAIIIDHHYCVDSVEEKNKRVQSEREKTGWYAALGSSHDIMICIPEGHRPGCGQGR